MRREQDIVQVQQASVRPRFILEHVQPGTQQTTLGQCLCQRHLVDHTAAPYVDQDACAAQRIEYSGIDQVISRVPTADGDHQKIHRRGQFGHRSVIRIIHRQRAPTVVADVHVERRGALRNRLADPTQANDSQAFATDLAGEWKRPLLPPPFTHETVGLGKATGSAEHQRDGEIGDVFGEHVRRVGDRNATGPGSLDVDTVVTDTEHYDHLQVRQAIDQTGPHPRLAIGDEGADAPGLGGIQFVAALTALEHLIIGMQPLAEHRRQMRDFKHGKFHQCPSWTAATCVALRLRSPPR
ncbi:hypothetical protein D3C87_1364560 [compost metagenome]